MIVSVPEYNKNIDLYLWKGSVINMTAVESRLMSIWDDFKSPQCHTSDHSFSRSLLSKNIIEKRIFIIEKVYKRVSDQYDGCCE